MNTRQVSDALSAAPARINVLAEPGLQALITATLRERAAALVLAATENLLRPESLTMLREQLRCPICLVSRPAGQDEAPASD